MVSDYREICRQGSPHITQTPSYCFSMEQVHSGSSMGPEELGRNFYQPYQSDHHQQIPHTHPHPPPHPHPHPPPHPHPHPPPHLHPQLHPRPHPHPHPHPHPLPFPYAHDMHEAIQRELEKEQIREEIIMSEIMRRRELEAEVRRELMMERELALRRGSHGFPFDSPSVTGFNSPMRLPPMETRAEGRSLEERIVPPLMERERLNGTRESGGPEALLFQRGSSDLRNSEVGKEKERIILGGKPNENTSGTKREVSTVDASGSPSDGNLRKKAKEEWSCALCKVSATSEQTLNEHLQGKKHKAKEAALRAEKGGKKYSIGLLPKKAFRAITVDPGSANKVKVMRESMPLNKNENTGSKTDDPPLQKNLTTYKLKKNEESLAAQKVQKDINTEKKKNRFWCELCQVGVFSRKVLNNHQKGKKHRGRLSKRNENRGVGQSGEKETVVEGGGAVGEPVEEEMMAEDGGAVDVNKPGDDSTKANGPM